MRKKLHTSKLKSYAMAAGAFIVAGNVAESQVVSTDVDPDVVLLKADGDTSYELDLNNDAVVDYTLHRNTYVNDSGDATDYMYLTGSDAGSGNINAVAGYTAAGSYYVYMQASALDFGAKINGDASWQTRTDSGYATVWMAWGDGSAFGQAVSNKYIGLKFYIGGEAHYGWVELSTSGNSEDLTIHAYAYETAADTEILAGETEPTLVEDLGIQNLNVFPNPSTGVFNIVAGQNSKIEVRDIAGKLVFSQTTNEDNLSIDLSDLTKGMYFLEVVGEKRYTSKLVLK